MSNFSSKENCKLLWDILNENPLFVKFTQNRSDMIFSVFEDDIFSFYEKNKNTNNLLELNKKFISHITDALVAKDNSHKKVQFEESFNTKKEEYLNSYKVEIPDPIDFSDNVKEDKLVNMDELIQSEMNKRQFDIKKIEEENNIKIQKNNDPLEIGVDTLTNPIDLELNNNDKINTDTTIKHSSVSLINEETISSIHNLDKRLLRLEEKMEDIYKLLMQILFKLKTQSSVNTESEFNTELLGII